MPNLDLSTDERKRIAQSLYDEYDAFRVSREELKQTWDEHEHMYQADLKASQVEIVKGLGGYAIPIWKPTLDRIVNYVTTSFFSQRPTVQCIDLSSSGIDTSKLERTLDNLAEKAGLELPWRRACRNSGNTNLGTVVIMPEVDDKGKVTGLVAKSVPAQRAIAYPKEVESYAEAKTAGYEHYMMRYRVAMKQQKGEWYETAILSGSDPTRTLPGMDGSSSTPPMSAKGSDEFVTLAFLVTEMCLDHYRDGYVAEDGGKDDYKRYLAVLDVEAQNLLTFEPFGAMLIAQDGEEFEPTGEYDFYESVPFVDIRLQPEEEDGLLSRWSIAYGFRQIQDLYSAIFTTAVQGWQMSAFGAYAAIGPKPKSDYTIVAPGQMIWLQEGTKIEKLNGSFDPGESLKMLEILQGVASALGGFGQLGNAEPLASKRTATEVEVLAQAINESKDEYNAACAPSIARIYELLLMYLKAHYADLSDAYGELIEISWQELQDLNIRMEVTGKSGASNPGMLLRKLSQVMGIVMQGLQAQQGTFGIDPNKLVLQLLQSLDLPFEVSTVMMDAENVLLAAHGANAVEQLAAKLMQQMQQQPGGPPNAPGGDQGVSTEPGMAPNAGAIGDAQGGGFGNNPQPGGMG